MYICKTIVLNPPPEKFNCQKVLNKLIITTLTMKRKLNGNVYLFVSSVLFISQIYHHKRNVSKGESQLLAE